MSKWITPDLHVKSLPKAGMWELTQELQYERGVQTYTVPVGFQTNLASIPWFLRWRFNVNGRHRRAAALHDYLYSIEFATRETCDAIFLDAMVDGGAGRYNSWVMHKGVRLGGWTRGRW